MKTCSFVITVLLGAVIFLSSSSDAAPLRPLGPADITGIIEDIKWVPDRRVKGRPGMSGTLGIDRLVKANFIVTLTGVEGVDAKTAAAMTGYADWQAGEALKKKGSSAFIILLINHEDRNFLKKGMKITVRGYEIAGDEGGTWAKFSDIGIRPAVGR